MKCPKCQGEMTEGIIGDMWGSVGEGVSQQEWGDGSKSWAKQLKMQKKIVTFCCQNCGYLESYAKGKKS